MHVFIYVWLLVGRSPSLNVAVTGSLILYDREIKRLRNEQKQKLMCQKGKQMMNQTSKIQKRMPEQDDSNSPVFKKIGVKKKSSPHDLRHDGIGGRNGVDSIKPSQLRYSGKHWIIKPVHYMLNKIMPMLCVFSCMY